MNPNRCEPASDRQQFDESLIELQRFANELNAKDQTEARELCEKIPKTLPIKEQL